MSRNGQEILFEGWLTKSPPTKRIWRGRWRRRWFTLHPGELPGQFVLSYYTDRNSRKLKGVVDLDQCEQVDVGLKFEDKKLKFDYMFAIKTPSRTYYLAADTQDEMKLWVKCICNICSLKATSDEEFDEQRLPDATNVNDVNNDQSSPVSSSPYIPISECITGKTPVLPNQPIKDFNALLQHNIKSSYFKTKNHVNESYELAPTYLNCDPRFYDTPKIMFDSNKAQPNYYNFDKNASPLQSPTDSESVFTDDDWSHNTIHSDHGGRMNPRPSNSSSIGDDVKKLNKQLSDVSTNDGQPPPPRPPKTLNVAPASASYLNLQAVGDVKPSGVHSKSNSISDESNNQNLISDEMYDFPRSHISELGKRHCYNNAAPSSIDEHVFTYDSNPSPKPSTSSSAQIFRYGDELDDPPPSPLSQTSSQAQYSNLPSPLLPDTQLMPPPKVNRGLKPKRKLSDSLSIYSNAEPSSPGLAPSVDRKLKPVTTPKKLQGSDDEINLRKIRAAPSPTPPTPGGSIAAASLRRSCDSLSIDNDNEQIYHYLDVTTNDRKILEYLDLHFDNKSNTTTSSNNNSTRSMTTTRGTTLDRTKLNIEVTTSSTLLRSPGANTVYKEVDFMKTEAFNITRNNLEKERNNVPILKK